MGALNAVFPIIEDEDRVWQDIFTLLAIGFAWKMIYIILALTRAQREATIQDIDGSVGGETSRNVVVKKTSSTSKVKENDELRGGYELKKIDSMASF